MNVETNKNKGILLETIRKPPLAEVQTTLRKIRSVERGYLSHCRNFTEIGQSAAELWPKTTFNMAAVHHLES